MFVVVGDVSDKVSSIQDSLSDLDVQLGHLQDLSALAVDSLTLLSASDHLHQEEARLGQCQSLTSSCRGVPQSWTLPHRNEANLLHRKSCKSTPPSLMKSCTVLPGRHTLQECHGGSRGGRREANKDVAFSPTFYLGSRRESLNNFRDQTPCESHRSSLSGAPLSPTFSNKGFESLWTQEPHINPEEEEEDQQIKEQVNLNEKTSSKAVLLSDPKDISEGLINPAFKPSPPSRPSSQWKSPTKHPRWSQLSRDHPYEYCRSLSSSVENMAFSEKPLGPNRGSFPDLYEPMMKECLSRGKEFRDDALLQATRDRKWSKSSDFTEGMDSKGFSHSKKTVKIQESHPRTAMQSELSETCWKMRRKFKGGSRCWSASASLSQLNLEPVDLLQKQMGLWSPSHSAWNSWARSISPRSSVQSVITNEVRTSSFQFSDNLYPHYSAMERNNLMRLAQTIPFTPVSLMGGEEVSIYSLQEEPCESSSSITVSSWSPQGLSAILQPLSSEEGSLDGGLRQGCRVLCTWAERDVLRPGLVYVVKAFHQEVVRAWQRYFHGSTALQLCLREIQQQRAAQKMMKVFNQVKPEELQYSAQFLDVMLVLWHSNGQWMTIERNLSGDFRKFNNNTGEEITPCCSLEETLLAFSHWTYEYSRREMLVLDIQGVGEELTDPTVIMADNHSGGRDEMLFGPDNLGETAIRGFLQKHTCNASCERLGLTELRRRRGSGESSTAESASENEQDDGGQGTNH